MRERKQAAPRYLHSIMLDDETFEAIKKLSPTGENFTEGVRQALRLAQMYLNQQRSSLDKLL